MESYYILIVAVLFILAISDLVVGVSNDAVNFLNSALGSKVAPFKIIMAIAALGVLVGAVFSNGMMEVARKGIFNPDMFAFSEIMVLFLAVMLTDILLLDFFNTVGLPTSTTVSIVFELLGSAVAIATFKLVKMGQLASKMGEYINTERAVLIISGIFLSIIIAFTVGMLIMRLVRLAFSFNLLKTSRYWSGLWGGIAITAIFFFLLIKGAKGSTLISAEFLSYIKEHTVRILLISFLGWTLLFQILVSFTKVNILKITVLVGTFALAMAFAGNDMVNFIGVPLAGFESFKAFTASGATNAGGFLMESLKEPVNTPIYFLIIAGLVMVVTLRFSKKAKSVTETEINLGRQGVGTERFASTSLARFIVRRSVEFSNGMNKFIPNRVNNYVGTRFDENLNPEPDKTQAFDLVRASVNLVVASILISIGTSLKLPLSTTYVTFMVAMGTSLADGAWGRESAVYRVTGVLTVIGGWFFTAFIAFCISFIVATLIFFGKLPVMLALILLAIFILLRTHAFHKKLTQKKEVEREEIITTSYEVLKSCNDEVKTTVVKASKILHKTYSSFLKEKYKDMKQLKKEAKHLNKDIKEIRENIPVMLIKFNESEISSGYHYVQVVENMKEMANSLNHTILPAFIHLDNNHPLDKEQIEDMKTFNENTSEFFNFVIQLLDDRQEGSIEELNQKRDKLLAQVDEIQLNRIKLLKKTQKGVKVSVTYLDMLNETKNLVLNVVKLVKANISLLNTPDQDIVDVEQDVLD
ncbi:MAG: inorganic phosphate transporter, partial [Bacteroidota bacterium]|nr:inorganic phosphate transporter [Bacteroidota bacterium]